MPDHSSPRRWTPRILLWAGIAMGMGLLLIGIHLARAYLWFGSPPAPTDYAAQLHNLARETSGIQPDSQDAWPLFQQILDVVIDTETAVSGDEARRPDGTLRLTIDFTALLRLPVPDSESVDSARSALAEQDRRGLGALLDRLAEHPAAARPAGSTGSLLAHPPEESTPVKQLVRAQTARFALAYRTLDEARAAAELRRGLAVAHVLGHQPTLIDNLVGAASTALLLQTVREELATRPPTPATAKALLPLVTMRTVAPLERALEGERIITLDALAATLPDSLLKPLSRGAQMEKVIEFYDLAIPVSRRPRNSRDAQDLARLNSFAGRLGPSYTGASLMLPALDKAMLAADSCAAMQAGTILMLAVETYAATRGGPPETLDQLTPDSLPAIPQDPFSATGFVYRVLTAGDSRSYLLYSVGLDGHDDGGKTSPDGPFTATAPKGAGFDVVLNARR